MKALKIVAGVLGALVVSIVLLFVVARFMDGPMEIIPGGAFASGEWVDEPVTDWSFVTDLDTLEMQLAGDSTSRTTWVLVDDGQAFIPCSLGFPPGKDWHLRADEDGAAILRIDGRRYPVNLTRIQDEARIASVKAVAGGKYQAPPSDAGLWFFEVQSRPRS